ncbi:MAG TPA: DNA polymerase III subunit delta [Caulobacteraceae bacterium]
MILKQRAEADRFLSKPPADVRAALIYGRDRGGVRERADALAKKLVRDPNDPFDVDVLGEGDLEGGARIADALAAISMMGGRRLVRLTLSGEKSPVDKIVAEALKAHLDGQFNAEAFFLIEAGGLGRESGLRKLAETAKLAVCLPVYDDEVGDLARLTRESLAKDGVSLTQEAMDLFVGRLPKERGVARQEIERLALFLGPGSVTVGGPELLQAHLGVEPEASLFDAADHAFGGRAAQAHAGLRRAMQEGEGGPMAVRTAGMHLAKLRRANVLVANGASAQEAAKASGVFWKQEREFLRQARAWSSDALDDVQAEILSADRACKTAGSPDALIAERLYLTTAAKARRLGL